VAGTVLLEITDIERLGLDRLFGSPRDLERSTAIPLNRDEPAFAASKPDWYLLSPIMHHIAVGGEIPHFDPCGVAEKIIHLGIPCALVSFRARA
jgi:hypothetical protein